MKFEIDVTLKSTGKRYNEIIGKFQTIESASSWCDNQSKGLLKYTLRSPEVSGENSGRTSRRPSKRKSSIGTSTRKRRKKES